MELSDLPLRLFYMGPHPNVEGNAFLRAAQNQSGVSECSLGKITSPYPPRKRSGPQFKAQRVDPFDLAATFGLGVKLVRSTLEVTGDPITPAPSNWPSWLKEPKKPTCVYIFPMRTGKNLDGWKIAISQLGCSRGRFDIGVPRTMFGRRKRPTSAFGTKRTWLL